MNVLNQIDLGVIRLITLDVFDYSHRYGRIDIYITYHYE